MIKYTLLVTLAWASLVFAQPVEGMGGGTMRPGVDAVFGSSATAPFLREKKAIE